MTTTSYTTGTITLTNGSAEIVGHGTGWATAAIIGGVIYPGAAGNALPFGSEPTDDTHITADVPWMGATGTYAYALVRDTAPGRQAAANAQTLTAYIARLGNPALSALAALGEDMAADRLAYATGDGSMAWTGFSEAARVLLEAEDAAAQVAALEAVPVTRTVNGKALTADVVLSAADVGLGDVDNTSDDDKPVSAAQQAAFDALGGDLAKRIRYDAAQALTAAEQGQAVANIGAGVLAGFREKIINGDFEVWQRGVSQNAPGYQSADRWNIFGGGAWTFQRALNAPNAFPDAPKYSGSLTVTTGADAGDPPTLQQRIEEIRQFNGKKITFRARIFPNVAMQVIVAPSMVYGAGGSSADILPPRTQNLMANAWNEVKLTFDLTSLSGKVISETDSYLQMQIRFPAGLVFSASCTRISVVEGDAIAEGGPPPPRHIQQELALCQRYHQRINCGLEGYFPYAAAPLSYAVPFVPMRSTPIPTEVYIAGGGIAAATASIIGSAVWYKLEAAAAGMAWRQSVIILDNEM